MKMHWVMFCLSMVLLPAASNAQQRTKTLYELAIEALNRNDCPGAVTFLEKYKIDEADQLSRRPEFLKLINLQISECRNTPSRISVRLIAGADVGSSKVVGVAITAAAAAAEEAADAVAAAERATMEKGTGAAVAAAVALSVASMAAIAAAILSEFAAATVNDAGAK